MLCQGMTDSPSVEWNEPTQARSREKVERIEQAARALLIETGSLDLKMTEVAKRAKVPVGTLYQFFPSRTALVQKLFAIEMQRIDTSVSDMLFAVEDLSLFEQQLEPLPIRSRAFGSGDDDHLGLGCCRSGGSGGRSHQYAAKCRHSRCANGNRSRTGDRCKRSKGDGPAHLPLMEQRCSAVHERCA